MSLKWCAALLTAVVLCLCWGLPFEEYDTAELLPLGTVQVARQGGRVMVRSEAGSGTGENFAEAVEALKAKAAGQVFFETAEHIVLCDPGLLPQVAASPLLRPAAKVYFSPRLIDSQGLNRYLSAHSSSLTIGALRGNRAMRALD